ncbi:DNA-binding Lrp family transcriptional regulator [Rhodococcus sp. LBL1]|uniref:DNA-binding Lrp family transcriptional regulator n=1 Tax=Prescottella agglutinans TaxID=1644129 RepID=A0ABT6M736_9NOCA|nr:Lrp/AsnC family transcriptional regulator [Prescottella agglutinans]MDH6280114.1 DNA-binding Lrp family transcriptional regulator [Prescottella agglutinans]MDH6676887.1 DNA-binding Lrp family transcriptional regulator [Rhodococcus sp. LBL1]MDH6682820.1 DNA-binding Lrp family transcriptional regulator [Rhodococcus sp. LBL2]
MDRGGHRLDALDVDLIARLRGEPRIGMLELSRRAGVARATVQARLRRLEESGIVTGYGPEIDLRTAGYPVQAFVTLEIAQGSLGQLTKELEEFPEVVQAWATTGAGDVLCRVAAASHDDLQALLIELHHSSTVARSVSVVVLSEIVAFRTLPLIAKTVRPQDHDNSPRRGT